jgi:hypothetical protein
MSTLEVFPLLPQGADKAYEDLALENATVSYMQAYIITVLYFPPREGSKERPSNFRWDSSANMCICLCMYSLSQ